MTRALYHAERLSGVCDKVQAFFRWWSERGPFPLVVDKSGGMRTDETHQALLFSEGRSKARALAETPHGRGGAADAYPAKVVADTVVGIYLPDDGPVALERFGRYGALAEAHGLSWGGRWVKAFPPLGDMPHVEVPGWRELPFPPVIVPPYPVTKE